MNAAEDWAAIMLGDIYENTLLARRIQADCLRYAANMSGEERETFLLELADKLDPQPPHPKP